MPIPPVASFISSPLHQRSITTTSSLITYNVVCLQIFSEMIRTSSGQELERRLSETLGMMEIKRAWTSSTLFADHPVLT